MAAEYREVRLQRQDTPKHDVGLRGRARGLLRLGLL